MKATLTPQYNLAIFNYIPVRVLRVITVFFIANLLHQSQLFAGYMSRRPPTNARKNTSKPSLRAGSGDQYIPLLLKDVPMKAKIIFFELIPRALLSCHFD